METKKEKQKEFDAVEFMRQVRDSISKETKGMNFEELKNYFEQRRLKLSKPH